MTIERERPLEVRLEYRLETLKNKTREIADQLRRDGYHEETIAEFLAIHEMINRAVDKKLPVLSQQPRLMDREPIDASRRVRARFVERLHGLLTGFSGGIFLGKTKKVHERYQRFAEEADLRTELRSGIEKWCGSVGEDTGLTEHSQNV